MTKIMLTLTSTTPKEFDLQALSLSEKLREIFSPYTNELIIIFFFIITNIILACFYMKNKEKIIVKFMAHVYAINHIMRYTIFHFLFDCVDDEDDLYLQIRKDFIKSGNRVKIIIKSDNNHYNNYCNYIYGNPISQNNDESEDEEIIVGFNYQYYKYLVKRRTDDIYQQIEEDKYDDNEIYDDSKDYYYDDYDEEDDEEDDDDYIVNNTEDKFILFQEAIFVVLPITSIIFLLLIQFFTSPLAQSIKEFIGPIHYMPI